MLHHLLTATDWQNDICIGDLVGPGTIAGPHCQDQCGQVRASNLDLASDVPYALFYSYKSTLHYVCWPGTLRRWVAIDWPTHVSDVIPMVVVQNQNQILSNHYHHKYTSRVQCDSCQQHPLNCQQVARVQIYRAWVQNKKHQTCIIFTVIMKTSFLF